MCCVTCIRTSIFLEAIFTYVCRATYLRSRITLVPDRWLKTLAIVHFQMRLFLHNLWSTSLNSIYVIFVSDEIYLFEKPQIYEFKNNSFLLALQYLCCRDLRTSLTWFLGTRDGLGALWILGNMKCWAPLHWFKIMHSNIFSCLIYSYLMFRWLSWHNLNCCWKICS